MFSQSPKHQREIADISQEVDIQFKKIGYILSTRWVASSYRTVNAVLLHKFSEAFWECVYWP